MNEFFLHPGEIKFSETPARILTILGSCVAVCVYDIELKHGGMCHYYLPKAYHSTDHTTNKYGLNAIPNLLKEFKKRGSKVQNLRAKVVGGGHVLDAVQESETDVGKENIRIALELLHKFGIKIEGKKVGGFRGKKVRFFTESGLVQIKEIEQTEKIPQPPPKINPIKVMVVDDSKPMRLLLAKMIEEDPLLKVIHVAEDANEAQLLMRREKPDVITLDIQMPGMSGIDFLKVYMQSTPIPTIMVSGFTATDFDPIMESLENGAFDFIKKPSFSDTATMAKDLQEKIKQAFKSKSIPIKKDSPTILKEKIILGTPLLSKYIVAIGASTGGTEALKELLIRLPENVPPIVIVQHIPPGFSRAFANRLNALCSFKVKEAENGDILQAGNCYVAPGDFHMRFIENNGQIMIKITEDPPVNRFRPSVDYMFNSVIDFTGRRKVMGILLTGMGDDGAKGLLQLKRKGVFTVAQDEATSIVYGMPKVAKELGATSAILPLDEIPRAIAKWINT